jgi:hypothetical protein
MRYRHVSEKERTFKVVSASQLVGFDGTNVGMQRKREWRETTIELGFDGTNVGMQRVKFHWTFCATLPFLELPEMMGKKTKRR